MIRIRTETEIFAPCERCFDCARSIDLHAASSRIIRGRAVAHRTRGLAVLGDKTTWSARFFGVRFVLTTQITEFDRPRSFRDCLCAGLFTHFGHVYTFQSLDHARTLMTDDFFFQSPFGVLGIAFDTLVLQRRMRAVASFRAGYLKRVAESDEWKKYLSA